MDLKNTQRIYQIKCLLYLQDSVTINAVYMYGTQAISIRIFLVRHILKL